MYIKNYLGPMIDCVHGCDIGEERLGCTDVRCGLVPPDVLLPGLEGKPEGVLLVRVLGDSHHPARHASHVLVLCRKKSCNTVQLVTLECTAVGS